MKLEIDDTGENELFILRVGSQLDQGIILQTWHEFRIYKDQKFTDCFYRHLHCNRDDDFLLNT